MDQKNEQDLIKIKKEKIYSVFGNLNKSLFILAFVLIILVRFYFFFITQNQPLWWDESEYMSGAKAFAGIVDYQLSSIRSPGFSYLASVFFMLGIDSEFMLRFFLIFIPSLIALFLTYFVIKEMYGDNMIAVMSMIIMAFIWEHIFYSNRFHTENLSLIFQYLAIYVLFKGYVKRENIFSLQTKKPALSLTLVFVFMAISLLFRPGNIVYVPAVLLFIPIINMKSIINNKKFWYPIITTVLFLTLIGLFFLDKIPLISSYYNPQNSISFSSLSVFYGFYNPSLLVNGLLFYFFALGILMSILYLYLKFPITKDFAPENKDMDTKSDIFNLLLILSVMVSFIFLLRVSSFEYRWFFPMCLGLLVFTCKGIKKFSSYTQKISKDLPAYIILAILILSCYGQFAFSKNLVESKVTSYEQVKEAGLWVKENSDKEDIIISASTPQTTYYSERKTYGFALNEKELLDEETFNQKLSEVNPKYILISVFEPSFTPEWIYSWPQSNQDSVVPVQAYYADSAKTQPVLIIYEYRGV